MGQEDQGAWDKSEEKYTKRNIKKIYIMFPHHSACFLLAVVAGVNRGLVIALPSRGSWRIPLEVGPIQCYANSCIEQKKNTSNAPFSRLPKRLPGTPRNFETKTNNGNSYKSLNVVGRFFFAGFSQQPIGGSPSAGEWPGSIFLRST